MVHLLNGAYEINVNKNRAESRFIAVIFVIYKHAELSLFGSFLVLFPLAQEDGAANVRGPLSALFLALLPGFQGGLVWFWRLNLAP